MAHVTTDRGGIRYGAEYERIGLDKESGYIRFPDGQFAHFTGPDDERLAALHALGELVDSGRADGLDWVRKDRIPGRVSSAED